jgi:hypothetical protein
MYYQVLKQMEKTLGQLDQWLVAASAHAEALSFEPSVFLDLRLAPDQFPFVRQVRTACDTAKLAASRLSGKEAAPSSDEERSLDELRTRVQGVIGCLQSFTPKDFDGAGERRVSQPRWEGRYMLGEDYLMEHALPNFFFHSTHAYAILRHNGVKVGKRAFLGTLSQHSPDA